MVHGGGRTTLRSGWLVACCLLSCLKRDFRCASTCCLLLVPCCSFFPACYSLLPATCCILPLPGSHQRLIQTQNLASVPVLCHCLLPTVCCILHTAHATASCLLPHALRTQLFAPGSLPHLSLTSIDKILTFTIVNLSFADPAH